MTPDKPPPSNRLPVRELTRNVWRALLADEWPSPAGVLDFGIASADHLGALQYEVRTGRVTLEQLDDALGWGPALNNLIGDDNPYRGVEFTTQWDSVMVPIREWATVAEELFPLGRLFATPEVLKLATHSDIIAALKRHAAGDWDERERLENDAAAKNHEEILSTFPTADGREFYLRTWFEPPMTLALLEWQLEL